MLSRISRVCVFVAAIVLAGCSSPPSVPRNAVIVVIDALRADHLSSYGYQRPTSPNMDRLAQSSTRFVNGIMIRTYAHEDAVKLPLLEFSRVGVELAFPSTETSAD